MNTDNQFPYLVQKIYELKAAMRPALISSLLKVEAGQQSEQDLAELFEWVCRVESNRSGISVENVRNEFIWMIAT